MKKDSCYQGNGSVQNRLRDTKGRFIKGSSGNPLGRKTKEEELRHIESAREFLNAQGNGQDISRQRLIFEKLYKKAIGEDAVSIRAAEVLLKYAHPLPKQELELSEPETQYKNQIIQNITNFVAGILRERPEHDDAYRYFMGRILEESDKLISSGYKQEVRKYGKN